VGPATVTAVHCTENQMPALGLEMAEGDNRRVLAVLRYLES
jgi:hypothetical protein